MQTFVRDDGGYTTLAVVVALLVSLTLVFGTAAAHWALARAADVQEVADATAMAGENCVAAYATVTQVLDACVLTMGLAGAVVCGAALVVSAIPPLQAKAAAVMSVGKRVLEARRSFAASAAKGLQRLEEALPALIMANSASCAAANSHGGISYVGMAVPFPQNSESDFSFMRDDLDADEMKQDSEELAEASARKEEAHKRASAAKEVAWRADNIDNPMCMRSRVTRLTSLGDDLNPFYPAPDVWEFEYARVRARNYYACRYADEHVGGSTADELQRSAARKQFFGYAYEVMGGMSCVDTDEEVIMDLDELPHRTEMVYPTRLYTDVVWPCTDEEDEGVTLHCSLDCPGALGAYVGNASLSDIDGGLVRRCSVCLMDAQAMGNVADASTNINNGFEHYWRIVVEASREYERARNDEIAAERDMRAAAEKGRSAFDKAMEILTVNRPKICPPGAWGCVSVVCRPSATTVPTELTASFLSGASLPAGAAVSAAALAPDSSTENNTVLARAFDGLRSQSGNLALDLVGSVTGLWGDLLVGYGSAYGSVVDAGERFISRVEGVFGQRVASWLRDKLTAIVSGVHLEPADLRLRKPVIVNSQTVLDKAGLSNVGKVRELVEELPSSPQSLVALLRSRIVERLGSGPVTIAELPIPGLEGVSVPLTIDLSKVGAS
ncbi:MAG: hypothetical protein J6D34_01080 [Atopobiaceae bacterium]|nr:hypothetical protein [Atopobiaceae bacterium]